MSGIQSTTEGESYGSDDDYSSGEPTVMENTNSSDEKKKKVFWKYSCVLTGIALVLLILLIVVMSFVLFFEFEESIERESNGEMYSFVGTKDGELTFKGGVLIDQFFVNNNPFQNSVFGAESEDGRESVVLYPNSEDILYEITSNLHCCPGGRRELGSCGNIITSEKTIFPGKTESQVRKDSLKKFDEKNEKFMEIQLCDEGEHLTRFISKIEEKKEIFHCHATCEGSTLSYFLHHNPRAVKTVLKGMKKKFSEYSLQEGEQMLPPSEEDAKLDIKLHILDRTDAGCRHLNVHADSQKPKSKEEMDLDFEEICELVCSSPSLQADNLEGNPMFSHICQVNPFSVDCRSGGCWDPGFHEGVESVTFGDHKTGEDQASFTKESE